MCRKNLHIAKTNAWETNRSYYTAGEGFLTSYAKFLTILFARIPVEMAFSTTRSRLRVPLAEKNLFRVGVVAGK